MRACMCSPTQRKQAIRGGAKGGAVETDRQTQKGQKDRIGDLVQRKNKILTQTQAQKRRMGVDPSSQQQTNALYVRIVCVFLWFSHAGGESLSTHKWCVARYLVLQTDTCRLWLWQSISCGLFWFAHVGGAQLSRHNGPRREFLVIGNGLLEAAEALDEATIGTLVVSHKRLTF